MTPQQLEILTLEKRWYRTQAAKEEVIMDELGLSPVRYYQLLAALLDEPTALEAEPVLVKRLSRIRDARARSRRAA